MEEIKVVISKTGEVTVDVAGMKGQGCKQLTKKLQDSLGETVADKTKGEYYENENSITDTQGLGRGY